ncbi:MAG: LptF/LptG family permease [Muribaculaceae bacterium]|nr:LptF/LptG family permease [Muribaculaceae bacterium]
MIFWKKKKKPESSHASDEEQIEPNPAFREESPEAVAAELAGQSENEAIKEEERIVSSNPNVPKRVRWKNPFKLYILDLYILKKFLGTFFLATILFLAVIAMFDITEKLDAFLVAPFKETIFDYFCSFLPYFGNQLSPLFVFISVIFFTSKMAGNSEIIAILSSGVSFRRLLRPYMIGAAVIAAFTFVLSNYVIPPTNVRRIAYTNKYVKNKKVESNVNVQLQVSPGVVAFIGRFEDRNKTGYRFSLDKFKNQELVSRTTATTVRYDTTKTYHWVLSDYMTRDFDGMKETITRGSRLDTIIPFEPRDFMIAVNDQETLTTPQLTEYIRKQKERGVANIKAFEIEKEKRIASTAAAFILTLIGMSLSSRKVKGGMGINIGIGLVLSFSYILFSTVTSSFAISGLTTPFVAMEIPNVIYLLIGIFLYYRASKY